MAKLIELKSNKTYATAANAIKAAEDKYPSTFAANVNLRYIVTQGADGRYFPVFLGEEAVRRQVFFNFTCAM